MELWCWATSASEATTFANGLIASNYVSIYENFSIQESICYQLKTMNRTYNRGLKK